MHHGVGEFRDIELLDKAHKLIVIMNANQFKNIPAVDEISINTMILDFNFNTAKFCRFTKHKSLILF